MKKKNFFALLLGLALVAVIASCSSNANKTANSESAEKSNTLTSFCLNGKFGVQDQNGNTIIPAEYDEAQVIKDVTIAHKGQQVFIFKGKDPLFSHDVKFCIVEEQYINAVCGEKNSLYFFNTEVKAENITIISFEDSAFLCMAEDGSYSFYSEDGWIKGKDLRDISCLQKITDGYVSKRYYAFKKADEGRLIYSVNGDLLYDLSLFIWQKIGINYLERDYSEDREFQVTYNYKIDLDRCIKDYLKGTPLDKYPEE